MLTVLFFRMKPIITVVLVLKCINDKSMSTVPEVCLMSYDTLNWYKHLLSTGQTKISYYNLLDCAAHLGKELVERYS